MDATVSITHPRSWGCRSWWEGGEGARRPVWHRTKKQK